MSSACFFRMRTYSSSLDLSSDLISVMSSSLEAMMLLQEVRCFSISWCRSCGTSMENRSAHRMATAAFCRADDSASDSSLLRSSCRRCSSAMRRWFSRSSPDTLTLVTSASDLAFSRSSRRLDSMICCFPLEISSRFFSFSRVSSSSPVRMSARRSWMRLRRAMMRSIRSELEFLSSMAAHQAASPHACSSRMPPLRLETTLEKVLRNHRRARTTCNSAAHDRGVSQCWTPRSDGHFQQVAADRVPVLFCSFDRRHAAQRAADGR
mmetsp:Transcript_11115/g.28488  ORF Transcript_11115/g.28488 Transcript_11115/m.28488 type:complete len:265 (+) Transcript_11115:1484-2278(+)